MSESKFLSPLKALKRPGDIIILLLLCASLWMMLGWSLYHDSIATKTWAVTALLLAAINGGYFITNYTRKDDEVEWMSLLGSTVFTVSLTQAAFVHLAWLPFAWLLPLEFLTGWQQRCRGHRQKRTPTLVASAWWLSILVLGIHATYQAVNGHWTLWLPAGIFFVACGVWIGTLLLGMVEVSRARLRQRRETRERERAWRRDKPVIDALLPIFREFTTEWGYEGYLRAHEKHDLRKEDLLTLIDGSLRGLKVGREYALRDRDCNAADANALRRHLTEAEQALSHSRASRIKLAKLVFEILARFRQTPAPVNEGTLAQWRRDIGFELVASHLLDLHPDAFEAYLADWLVSGACIKALLRHDQVPVTGYPSLSDEWQRALSAIHLANTVAQDEDAVPSAPAPAP